MLFYVVTYDIPSNRRRKQVADLLEGYGRRVQYSVFECVLSAKQYVELQARLRSRLKLEEDSVRFYPLSQHTLAKVEAWGGVPVTDPPGSVII
jgi:CRISPR-associated protein Cas2